VSKLTLDHPKRVLHLGADARLELFQLIRQGVADQRFVQRLALATKKDVFLADWP
jgi:hypothetical protein